MIKQKKKKCVKCGRIDYLFSKGRCKPCATKDYGGIKRTSVKKSKAKKSVRTDLDAFFTVHITRLVKTPYSFESGVFISNPSRINIAHLFPKRNHKSVATEGYNVVYLTWQEHTDFDYWLDTRQFEKIEEKMPNTWNCLLKVLPLVQERTKLVIALNLYVNE